MFDISKQKVTISCPACGRMASVTLGQIGRQEVYNCGCGQSIQLIDKDRKGKKAMTDINRTMQNLEKTLKKFGR